MATRGMTAGPDLQLQAKALGDATRHDIFRYVAAARRPVDIAELTEHTGLHHNAVRQHLAQLVAADLVVESSAAPTGRGRPRLVYDVSPAADGRWGVAGPYERLSIWLAEAVRTGDSPADVGVRAGRRAAQHSTDMDDDPADTMARLIAAQGFEPTTKRSGDHVEFVLHACPYSAAAVADASTVCELHRGIAAGMAEALTGIVVDELVVKDPRRATCRLRCRVEPTGAGR